MVIPVNHHFHQLCPGHEPRQLGASQSQEGLVSEIAGAHSVFQGELRKIVASEFSPLKQPSDHHM